MSASDVNMSQNDNCTSNVLLNFFILSRCHFADTLVVSRGCDAEPSDGVSLSNPVGGQEAGEEGREAAVLQK